VSAAAAPRIVPLKLDQFASGLRLLASRQGGSEPRSDPTRTVVLFDLIRPKDLVVLSVEAVGCELVDGDPPRLRPTPGEPEARLVIHYPFQHLAEQAFYEGGATVLVPDELHPDWEPLPSSASADPRPFSPVGVRASRASRLVFKVPEDEAIPFTTEGVLAAMARLEPALHKLAMPGDAPTGQSLLKSGKLADTLAVGLPGGLIGFLSGNHLYVRQGTGREASNLGLSENATILERIQYDASAARIARRLLRNRTAQLDSDSSLLARPGSTLAVDLSEGGVVDVRPIFGAGGLVGDYRSHAPVPRSFSSPPTALETAIEAPFRLIISPGSEGRWTHALRPVEVSSEHHAELWHSRLHTPQGSGEEARVEERDPGRRIVRAIWTRDRDGVPRTDWQNPQSPWPPHADDPFRMSLDAADRHMLVRQTSETIPARRRSVKPTPLAADLWLSSLGAYLKLLGTWDTRPYSTTGIRSILALDYRAPLGRDQHVEVAYPGYLYPFGHQAALVKVTDRKMKEAAPSLAALYQRKFLVIGEPLRTYPDRRNLPFTQVEIRPRVTPSLNDPGAAQDSFFWPHAGGQPFLFEVRALDQDMNPVRLSMPLLWVAEHYQKHDLVDGAYEISPHRVVPAHGQQVAFAPNPPGASVTALPASVLRFLGRAQQGSSVPRLSSADVLVPAVEQLSPTGPVPICYHPLYKSSGFDPEKNKAELWAAVIVAGEVAPEQAQDRVVPLPQLRFGPGGTASDKGGGFLTPSMPIRGLSRVIGAAGSADADTAKLVVDPKTILKGAAPKLFGVVDLSDLAVEVDSDLLRIPKLVSEFLSRVEALVKDIGRAAERLADAVDEARRLVENAAGKPQQWIDDAKAALADAEKLKDTVGDVGDKLKQALAAVEEHGKSDPAANAVNALKAEIDGTIADLEKLAEKMPAVAGNILRSLAELLRTAVQGTVSLLEDMYRNIHGLAESGTLARIRFEWKPEIRSWPDETNPFLKVEKDSLSFSVAAQAGMNGKNEIFASAQLSDFTLHLFPKAELVRLQFDRFGFKSGGGKPEVDVVFRKISFHGVLSFVDGIRKLIPLDGFSDPPMVKIEPEGLTAGFRLDLPDLAMGMFSITNMSLNADVQVPFLGKAVTVGFSFCTRDRPFTISVAFIGGGGWCGIRLSADGLEVLEVGLEAGACIAVDFGVASGSVAAMLGIYIRLEGEAGTIAGYFRLRGEVDVLGLINAAIELYMALLYHTESGKLVGEARITVNVSVLGLSKSVSIHAQRTFRGSNADPSFRDVMGVQADGSSEAWSAYCSAFAGED
jgi:hypothetical protein